MKYKKNGELVYFFKWWTIKNKFKMASDHSPLNSRVSSNVFFLHQMANNNFGCYPVSLIINWWSTIKKNGELSLKKIVNYYKMVNYY